MLVVSKNALACFIMVFLFFVIVLLNIGYSFTLVPISLAAIGSIFTTVIYIVLHSFALKMGLTEQTNNKFFIGIFALFFVHILFLPRELIILTLAFIGFLSVKKISAQHVVAPAFGGIFATLLGAIFGSYTTSINNYPVANEALNKPSIIHVVFDAYASKVGLPAAYVDIESINGINQNLLAQGFDVYTNSLSSQSDTKKSLTELLNKDFDWSADQNYVDRPGEINKYDLIHADVLEEIIKNREIVTWSTYIDVFRPIPKNENRFYRNSMRSNDLPENLGDLNYDDQAQIMVRRLLDWILDVQKVQIASVFYRYLGLKNILDSMELPTSRLQPIRAVELLDDMIEDVLPKMGRGQYLFSHIILPHFPYVLSKDCTVNDIDQWSSGVGSIEDLAANGDDIVRKVFADYFEQIKCADKMQQKIISAINKNPNLKDAIIIFHADHGSKIVTAPMLSALPSLKSNAVNPNNVVYAAFLAVRLNSQTGNLIDEPVLVQDEVKKILQGQH